jgi:hypothetical protein
MAFSVMDTAVSAFTLAAPNPPSTQPIAFSMTDRGGMFLKTAGTVSAESGYAKHRARRIEYNAFGAGNPRVPSE